MTSYEEFREAMIELGWDYCSSDGVWRDSELQPIDRERVLAAFPGATWDQLTTWWEELEHDPTVEIVEEENMLSVDGPYITRVPQFGRTEVTFKKGPFDGKVVLTDFNPRGDERDSPAEWFAYSLSVLAADGAGGQSLVGSTHGARAVDPKDGKQNLYHIYVVDSVDIVDGPTLKISCTFVETLAGYKDPG